MIIALSGCHPPIPDDPLTADALRAATESVTSIGPRRVTTPEEALAHDAVVTALGEAGIDDVQSEPFVWDAWAPGTAVVRVGTETIEAEALSPSPTVSVAGRLVDGDAVDGAIALRWSEDASRGEQFADVALGGGLAMIRATSVVDVDGGGLVEVGHTLAGATMPAVAVDAAGGGRLLDAVGSDVTVEITSDTVVGHTSWNVLARVAGSDPVPLIVVAHYDSWHPSECAADNALGVGMALVLARWVATLPPPERDVWFLFTSGEEQGLQGAFAWAEAYADELPGARVITLDIPWAPEGEFSVRSDDARWTADALAAAADAGVAATDGGSPGLASDHFPIALRGATAMWNQRWPYRNYHAAGDTIDRIDFDEAAAVLQLHAELVRGAAW